jgi:feruloyl esterase
MWYGFATTSTDTGHESGTAEWAYQNEEALTNWGYRAMHDTVLKAKSVIAGYYQSNITYSYYHGCSAGGKQGLKEVEMFPDDFDGVVAGAPAWWTTHLQVSPVWFYSSTATNQSTAPKHRHWYLELPSERILVPGF